MQSKAMFAINYFIVIMGEVVCGILPQINNKIINSFATDNILVCGWLIEPAYNITLYIVPVEHFFTNFLGILKRSLQNY